jgi:hypothetical protein
MAQIFYVQCPACGQRFPCHPELWQVDYELLCPFCQQSFPQEDSPLITTMTGEQRAGRTSRSRVTLETGSSRPTPSDESEARSAESM